jgi:protein-S-isoprenylcysteine O-methyltransferase Ste14
MTIPVFTVYAMIVGWFGFAGAMFTAKRHPGQVERRRERSSLPGLAVQMLSYSIVLSVRRPPGAPLLSQTIVPQALLCGLTLALIAGSVAMVVAAVRTLGKQWSLAARVIEGHELITSGPYRLVRHPIYTGMLGMLVATGIAISTWWWLPTGAVLFLAGTLVRTRAEERLLRGHFGAAYDVYAARVPVLIPFIY